VQKTEKKSSKKRICRERFGFAPSSPPLPHHRTKRCVGKNPSGTKPSISWNVKEHSCCCKHEFGENREKMIFIKTQELINLSKTLL
jgi:hypothetical protein